MGCCMHPSWQKMQSGMPEVSGSHRKGLWAVTQSRLDWFGPCLHLTLEGSAFLVMRRDRKTHPKAEKNLLSARALGGKKITIGLPMGELVSVFTGSSVETNHLGWSWQSKLQTNGKVKSRGGQWGSGWGPGAWGNLNCIIGGGACFDHAKGRYFLVARGR